MIKLNIKKSKKYIGKLNLYTQQQFDNTIYNIYDKKLYFTGAQYILEKAISLSKPYKCIYTESQPSVYDNGDDITKPYYWTYTGEISLFFDNNINRKTLYNIKNISVILNKVWGYRIKIIITKNENVKTIYL